MAALWGGWERVKEAFMSNISYRARLGSLCLKPSTSKLTHLELGHSSTRVVICLSLVVWLPNWVFFFFVLKNPQLLFQCLFCWLIMQKNHNIMSGVLHFPPGGSSSVTSTGLHACSKITWGKGKPASWEFLLKNKLNEWIKKIIKASSINTL